MTGNPATLRPPATIALVLMKFLRLIAGGEGPQLQSADPHSPKLSIFSGLFFIVIFSLSHARRIFFVPVEESWT
jgi:hypothetical protein